MSEPVDPTAELFASLGRLGEAELRRLAVGFAEAEASAVRSAQRGVARAVALDIDVPGIVDVLDLLVRLSDEVVGTCRVFGLEGAAGRDARAAVLDAAVAVTSADRLSAGSFAELIGPWHDVTSAAEPG